MPSSILVDKLYIYTLVGCEHPNCREMFLPDTEEIGNQNASEPVDAWAVKLAVRAEKLGWRIGENEAALCPAHAVGRDA